MSKKKIAIQPKPGKGAASADDWVNQDGKAEDKVAQPKDKEPTRRMTFDLPVSLHTRMKVTCAKRGVEMATVLREMIEKGFPDEL